MNSLRSLAQQNVNYDISRKVWQILWESILGDRGDSERSFGYHDEPFENNTFKYMPYSWDEDWWDNDYHFWHKPSGFKIRWYKYALRGAECNMKITDEQFVDILYDCSNSLKEGKKFKILHSVDKWWELNYDTNIDQECYED